jgi:hypothetical protein
VAFDAPLPSRRQYSATRAITAWYLESYYGTPQDVGVAAMFCREERVGQFATDPAALAAGDGEALFRLLVTMTMFQRRSDLQIMRVLRGIDKDDARELTSPSTLLRLADQVDCPHAGSMSAIKEQCDLGKDAKTKRGVCTVRPNTPCHLKRHTELLKRYGHFGKVPTSAALAVRANGAESLAALKDRVWEARTRPADRAIALERAISSSWRVSEKISAMFLSAVTNRDLSGDLAPWAEGVDTTHFVIIDSNVDLFLGAVDYTGPKTYAARRKFIQALAKRVRLDQSRAGLQRYNPRVVQQGLYMFMSESNRRRSSRDCSNASPPICATCPAVLLRLCPRHAAAKNSEGATC